MLKHKMTSTFIKKKKHLNKIEFNLIFIYIFFFVSETLSNEERMLNYERYRTLVQNDAVGSNYT